MPQRPKTSKKKKKARPKEGGAEPSASEEAAPPKAATPAVWRPGQDPIEEGETLDYDPSAYDCLHALTLEYPSLSFDVVPDNLGGPRAAFPHSLYFVAATQADTPRANYVAFIRVNNLTQGRHGSKAAAGSDDDMSDSSDEDEEGPPVMHVRTLAASRGANRTRAMPQRPGVVAVWEDSGLVKVYDGTPQLEELAGLAPDAEASRARVPRPQPLASHAHSTEGFALDWARTAAGRLASGDNAARLHVWEPGAAGTWAVSAPFKGHTGSVEDIQWSPVEETVLASCSADRSVRVWDTRTRGKPQLTVEAHAADVNVIAWNWGTSYMLASGGDEGALRVWDLRSFTRGSPVADFAHHKAPVTSVEWSPTEASMLATSGEDGQLCVWDLALERDPEEEMSLADGGAEAPADLPPQLLFIHGGQTDLKEVHWHPQIPGMLLSTAADGFNIFKPSNVS